MNLETNHAQAIISLLEDAQDIGLSYVVFEIRPDMELKPHQLDFFDTLGAALDHWEARVDFGYLPGGEEHPVYYQLTDKLLDEIKQANPLTINKTEMNLNNLENLKEEVKELRFNDKLLAQMEQNMQKSLPEFQLHDSKPGNKGQVDFTLHFKKIGRASCRERVCMLV